MTKQIQMNNIQKTFTFLTVMGLWGCTGTTSVLKEDTQALTEQIDQSMAETRAFYEQQGRQRLDYLIGFLAARPSCTVESRLLILPRESRCMTQTERLRWRDCGSDPNSHGDCGILLTAREVIVSPRLTQPRQTTLTLMGAVSSYLQTMLEILQDDTSNTATELKSLQSRLGTLRDRVNKLRDDSASTEKSDQELDKQLDAIGNLVDLVRNADHQARDFTKLKQLVLEQGPAVNRALQRLLETYEKADKPLFDLMARHEIERARREYNDLGPESRAQLTTEIREQRIRAVYEPELRRLEQAALPDALAVGLRGLIASHEALQEAFKGNLTREQRQRAVQEVRRQLKVAFKTMAEVVKLFT